jgi:hypothetical protein
MMMASILSTATSPYRPRQQATDPLGGSIGAFHYALNSAAKRPGALLRKKAVRISNPDGLFFANCCLLLAS